MIDISEELKDAFDTKVDVTTYTNALALKAPLASPSFTGDVTVSGRVKAASFQSTSDRRLKENIRSLEEVDLGGVKAMRYQFRGGSDEWIGLIAQDVQNVLPDAVHEDSDGYLNIDYNMIVAVLVDKVNKLEREVKVLKEFRHA